MVKAFVSYYKSIPRSIKPSLSILCLLFFSFTSSYVASLKHLSPIHDWLFLSAVVSCLYLLLSFVFGKFLSDNGLDVKRVLTLSVISLAILAISLALSMFIEALSLIFTVACTVSTFISMLVFKFIARSKLYILESMVFIVPAYILICEKVVPLSFVFAVLSALLALKWMCLSIDKLGYAISPFRGTDIVYAFLDNWIHLKRSALNMIFSSMGKLKVLFCDLLYFKRGKDAVAWINFCIHFGPFRNVGSSDIPGFVIKRLESNNLKCIVTKGPSTHNENVVSPGFRQHLWMELARAILICEKKSRKVPMGVTELRSDCLNSLFISLGGHILCVMELDRDINEDLPFTVQKLVEAEIGSPVTVVDAHNSTTLLEEPYPFSKTFTEKEYNALMNVLANYRKRVGSIKLSEKCKIGFAKLNIPTHYEKGLGPGGIRSFVLDIDGKQFGMVVIDGNNILRDYKVNLSKDLKRRYGFEFKIITTDTHILDGRNPAYKYVPVGIKISYEELLKEITDCVDKAIEDLSPFRFSACRIYFPVITMEGCFDKLEFFLVESLKRLKLSFIMQVVLALLLSTLLFLH